MRSLAMLALALVLSLGCGPEPLRVRLVVAPPPAPDPFADVETIRLTASGPQMAAVQSESPRARGELRLPEIPFGPDRVIRVEGLDNTQAVVSRGESAPFSLTEDGPAEVTVPFARLGCNTVYYRDGDSDGVGNDAEQQVACTAPAGYASKGGDCDDGNEAIFPGQSTFFETPPRPGSFDADCDGQQTREFATLVDCKRKGQLCEGDGWRGSVPACGVGGTFVSCSFVTPNTCNEQETAKVQRCR